MGVGSFLLPDAISEGGFVFGAIGIVLLGLLSAYTSKILTRSERIMNSIIYLEDGEVFLFNFIFLFILRANNLRLLFF